MGGFVAEASGCCPSPVFGQLLILAYIVGGAITYIWLVFVFVRWARARYQHHGAAPDRS